jgi:hypothetical protein
LEQQRINLEDSHLKIEESRAETEKVHAKADKGSCDESRIDDVNAFNDEKTT